MILLSLCNMIMKHSRVLDFIFNSVLNFKHSL